MKYRFLFLFLLIYSFSFSKVNYNLHFIKDSSVVILPNEIEETSGLQYINGFLYTFNDSGGENILYKINPQTGEIVQKIILENATNIDWEDIAFDKKNIYVADFGNNLGHRQNLVIYYFDFNEIPQDVNIVRVSAKKLNFKLQNQINFQKQNPLVTDFDMEALAFYKNKLHVFTKEWSSHITHHYTLNTIDSFQQAILVDSFDSKSLITSVDIYNEKWAMTAYTKKGKAFLYLGEIHNQDFFESKPQIFKLGFSPLIGQIEAVAFAENGLYISGEKINLFGFSSLQKLYFIPYSKLNKQ